MPYQAEDEELGFLGAAARALPSAVHGVRSIEGIFSGSNEGDELGFVDMIGKATGSLLKGIGKGLKKKKKKKPAATAPNKKIMMEPQSIVGEIKGAVAEHGAAGAAAAIAATAGSAIQEPGICTQPGGCIPDILQLTAGQ